MRALVDAKVDSQFARAMRYVEAVGARAVVPSAGPPAFLDPELFHLNVIDGDELSIFPDQRAFLDRLAAAGHRGILAIPGTAIEVTPDGHRGHPPDRRRRCRTRSSTTRRRTSATYQADWMPWLDELQGDVDPPLDRPAGHAAGAGGSRCWRWPRRCASAVGANVLLPCRRPGDS